MHRISLLITGLFLLFLAPVRAQQISGTVSDIRSHQTVFQALIVISGDSYSEEYYTDISGKYQSAKLAVGRYQIRIEKQGYQTINVLEVLIGSQKDQTFNHLMTPAAIPLEEVVIRASNTWEKAATLTRDVISIEQTQRIAANFADPARVATAYAGVSTVNDQANHMTIRGLSPIFTKYHLEGLEIVNPNHTNNAGTLSDLPTQAGGGVNLFSYQVLGNTTLSKGAHPIENSNALSGIVDMNYRIPSKDQTNYTVTAGLIGVEAGIEGPLGTGSQNSWMANYRYSTIGLLQKLGVPVGDEDIQYQDLNLQFDLPQFGKGGSGKIFGFFGRSTNTFTGTRNPEEFTEQKDAQDIRYENDVYGLGFKYRSLLGQHSVMRIGGLFSSLASSRRESFFLTPTENTAGNTASIDDILFHGLAEVQSAIGESSSLQGGLSLKIQNQEKNQDDSPIRGPSLATLDEQILRPYLSFKSDLTDNLKIDIGIALSGYVQSKEWIAEPSIRLTQRLGKGQVQANFAMSSQSFAHNPIEPINPAYPELLPSRSMIANLEYALASSKRDQWKASVFYQRVTDMPILRFGDGSLTYGEIFDNFDSFVWEVEGIMRSYGIEVSYEKYLLKDVFVMANCAIFKSEIEHSVGEWQDSRFNGNPIINVSAGKEWVRKKEDKMKRFGISTRITYNGGLLERPINEQVSADLSTTFYSSYDYTIKNKYFRADLSLYLLTDKETKSTRWSLDIQNVSNLENHAYFYWDRILNEVSEKKQLGIIPILSYRIDF